MCADTDGVCKTFEAEDCHANENKNLLLATLEQQKAHRCCYDSIASRIPPAQELIVYEGASIELRSVMSAIASPCSRVNLASLLEER